jgi:muramidase (phage lysozyme)
MNLTLEELEQLNANPNVRAMLDKIAVAEGTADKPNNGYNTFYGGEQIADLSQMTRKYLPGPDGPTSAQGRYQFVISTADPLMQQLGITDFSPHSQDLLAIARLAQEPGALEAVLAGDYDQAVGMLKDVWLGFRKWNGQNPGYGNYFNTNSQSGFNYPNSESPNNEGTIGDFLNAFKLKPLGPNEPIEPIELSTGSQYQSAIGMPSADTSLTSFTTQQAGIPTVAIPETPEDAAVIQRLQDYPEEISGRAMAVRENLLKDSAGPRVLPQPMPDINDLDLINMINSIKVE